MSANTNDGSGIGFVGLLTIAFVALKLFGVISWSWLWVLSPIWITGIVLISSILFLLIVFVCDEAFRSARRKK